jgi:hypothetical protein
VGCDPSPHHRKLYYAISTIAASSGADAPTVFFLSRTLVTTDETAAFQICALVLFEMVKEEQNFELTHHAHFCPTHEEKLIGSSLATTTKWLSRALV